MTWWLKLSKKKKNMLKQFIFHKPCVSSPVLSFHLYGISGARGDASVELREQALTGGAALAALAQSLTSLVGDPPQRSVFFEKKKTWEDVFWCFLMFVVVFLPNI